MRKHVIAGLKAKDPCTWFVAVHNATLHVCEDGPGNVPVEQNAITFSPQMRFFLADSASLFQSVKAETLEHTQCWWIQSPKLSLDIPRLRMMAFGTMGANFLPKPR